MKEVWEIDLTVRDQGTHSGVWTGEKFDPFGQPKKFETLAEAKELAKELAEGIETNNWYPGTRIMRVVKILLEDDGEFLSSETESVIKF